MALHGQPRSGDLAKGELGYIKTALLNILYPARKIYYYYLDAAEKGS